MAGTISLSLTQRVDNTTGEPLNGGKLYSYQAGTVATPQSAYQDFGLTLPWQFPLILDAGGNIPQLFFADGFIKIRLTNADGVPQLEADFVPVQGSSSGGGGGPSVDATTIYQTGDIKVRYGTGAHSGWVRSNGRTIGPATSGATERANADTQALFEYLWNTDANLAVSSGRGASSAADWATGTKTIALPDWRGRALAALDDMGNTASGRLTSAGGFGTSPIVLGAASTVPETKTLITANLPAYTPAGSIVSTGTVTSKVTQYNLVGGAVFLQDLAGGNGTSTNGDTVAITSTFTGTAQGGTSSPFSIVQPTMLATIYLKL